MNNALEFSVEPSDMEEPGSINYLARRPSGSSKSISLKRKSSTFIKEDQLISPNNSVSCLSDVEDPLTQQVILRQNQEISKIVSYAFKLPFLYLKRDEASGRKGVPVIFSAMKVEIISVDDESILLPAKSNFEIKIIYANNVKWSIRRSVLDIFKLHSILKFRYLQGQIPKLPKFPNQLSYIVDLSVFKNMTREERRARQQTLSENRRVSLQTYFQALLQRFDLNLSIDICEFLECSTLSLSKCVGWKGKEGFLRNRVFNVQERPSIWYRIFFWWRKKTFKTKWFMIRSTFIAYVDHIDQMYPSDVLLCDKFFQLIMENEGSNNILKPFSITILNGSHRLEVRPEPDDQLQLWLSDLNKLTTSIWSQTHRYDSFAPVRRGVKIDWFVDGKDYFQSVSRAITKAKEEIFIHGWWVSPELYLRRPSTENPAWRLDTLLQRKAAQGVRIYIVIFKEIALSLSINSYYTKTRLQKLHPNIRVQRNPDHFVSGSLYWAHHEKIVVIDQEVAYLGGIDLCYGRYDSNTHSLSDYSLDKPNGTFWAGLDYSNPRIRDFRNVQQHEVALIDRSQIPRLPWHDIHSVIYGSAARDAGRHFIQRWNFIKSIKAMHKEFHIPFLVPKPEYDEDRYAQKMVGSCTVQITRSASEWSLGVSPEISIYEAYLSLIKESQHFIYIENQFLISRSSSENTSLARNLVAEAIVNRIIRAHSEGQIFRVIVFLPLLPAFEADVDMAQASSVRLCMQGQYSTISRGPNSILGILAKHQIVAENYISFFGLRTTEILNGRHVTEQIYIHSKLMIIDDRVAVLGSANINDRSMLGVRDSEIAVIVNDEAKISTFMNGVPFQASKKVFGLRKALMMEHLGLLSHDESSPEVQLLSDPISHEFYFEYLRKISQSNTLIFRKLFCCIPDDTVTTWEEYKRFMEMPKLSSQHQDDCTELSAELSQVKGRVVDFPVKFMKNEDLVASILTPEYLLPIEVYL